MFYESLLCPANSEYKKEGGAAGVNGFVNAVCKCLSGYEPVGTQCMKQCDASLGFKSGVRDAYNNCVCEDGKKLSGTKCVTPAE